MASFKDAPRDDVVKIVLGPAAAKPVLLPNTISIQSISESSNKSSDAASNSAADCELVNNVKILDHLKDKEMLKPERKKETEIDCCKLI